jgi:diguanylate cyclase (GGDEF)-like protein
MAAMLLGHADQRGLVSPTGTSANAAIVLSQIRWRVIAVLTGAASLMVLGALGFVTPVLPSVWLGAVAYVALVLTLSLVVRRFGRAGVVLFLVLAAADITMIFTVVAALLQPSAYAAALFLSLVALQLAHSFLGIAPGLLVVGGSVLGYVALVTAAVERGALAAGGTTAAMLLMYLGVSVHALVRHARFNQRLARLVDLFSLAERGDFEQAYEDRQDGVQDGLTLVGRAYNHLRAELAALVLTDSLTGALNRRGFEQELARAVARASREAEHVALLAVDVDQFKRINDSFGHLAGDTVLRELAEVVAHSARTEDVLGRVGGDELVVLIPGADLEAAAVVAERIASVVRSHHFITTRGRERVTVSIGIAAEQVRDPYLGHALRARADEALYVAKRLGRDRVVTWAPGIRSEATPPSPQLAIDLDALHRNGTMRRLERAD